MVRDLGDLLTAIRISAINFPERKREDWSSRVLSRSLRQVRQNVPEGELRMLATAYPLPHHLAHSQEGRQPSS